jgi:hypothetical protein
MDFIYTKCDRDGDLVVVQMKDDQGNISLVYDGTDQHDYRHEVAELNGCDPLDSWWSLR